MQSFTLELELLRQYLLSDITPGTQEYNSWNDVFNTYVSRLKTVEKAPPEVVQEMDLNELMIYNGLVQLFDKHRRMWPISRDDAKSPDARPAQKCEGKDEETACGIGERHFHSLDENGNITAEILRPRLTVDDNGEFRYVHADETWPYKEEVATIAFPPRD